MLCRPLQPTKSGTWRIGWAPFFLLVDMRWRNGEPLWQQIGHWMGEAETPYIDNWFAKAHEAEIASWNRESSHGALM